MDFSHRLQSRAQLINLTMRSRIDRPGLAGRNNDIISPSGLIYRCLSIVFFQSIYSDFPKDKICYYKNRIVVTGSRKNYKTWTVNCIEWDEKVDLVIRGFKSAESRTKAWKAVRRWDNLGLERKKKPFYIAIGNVLIVKAKTRLITYLDLVLSLSPSDIS